MLLPVMSRQTYPGIMGGNGETIVEVDTWTCRQCGQVHTGLPFSYGSDAPEQWFEIPPRQRRRRARLGGETCELDEDRFFLRGRILIRVHDADNAFDWGVWVLLSREDYERAQALWTTPGREKEPPHLGRLATELPYEPSTQGLEVMVHTHPVGDRPTIEVLSMDHPLALEQGQGISLDRVREIAELLLHE